MLCEALAGHQISILVQFGFELLGTRLCDHVEKGRNLSMRLCQLFDGWLVLELREVNDIYGLDRQDDAPSSIIQSLSNRSITLFVKLEVGEDDLESWS